MWYSRRNNHEYKEGIVIVSISNLFHIIDISRSEDNEHKLIHKTNTRNIFLSEQGLNKEKEKENNLIKKGISKESDYHKTKDEENKEIKINSKSKESKAEESKEIKMNEKSKENKQEEYRQIKSILKSKEIKDDENKEIKGNIIDKELKKYISTEKDVKFKVGKESIKNTNKSNKKNFNKNNKKKSNSFFDYFFNFVLCNFLLLIFNNCYIWIFTYMFSDPKNKSYCYNDHIKEFGICHNAEYCPSSGNHDFIYITDESIPNINKKQEIQNINHKYLNFYLFESLIFSSLNKKFIKYEKTLSKYSITIISIKNEKYLFNNTFRLGCSSYFIELLLLISIASVIGNFIFGIMADIWGRKKILIIAVFIQIFGSYILITSTFYIQYIKSNNNISEITDYNISEFLREIDLNNDLIDNYKTSFKDIKQEAYESLLINKRFQKYKVFVFMGFFLIFSTNSSVKTITLSYLLENALTEEVMSLYFLFFNLSSPLSILLSSLMVIYLNSFYFPIIIITAAELIIIILIIIFFFESQRFNFEFCFYSRITEFAEYIIGKEELKTNYRVKDEDLKSNMDISTTLEKENTDFFRIYYSLDDYRIQSELNNEKINEHTSYKDSFKYPRHIFYKNLFLTKVIQKPTSKNLIERFILYKNPFYIYKLLKKDKLNKKKASVIFSFIVSLSIVINLSRQRITSNYLLQREKLISKTVFETYFFLYNAITYIILFPFIHYLVKCFGIYIILFPSLILITFSTAFFELVCFIGSNGDISDLNQYHDGENDNIVYSLNSYLLPLIVAISISFIGLEYVLYFFIIKLTKTIYRCTLLSNCQIIYDLCFVIGFGIEKYISGGYFYGSIFSIITIVNSLYINSSEDSLNIREMREIKLDENINNEKQ